MRRTVLSLCDLTGNIAKPWLEAGYEVVLVDPQHGTTRTEGNVLKIAETIEGAYQHIGEIIRTRNVAIVLGFPPCTNLAVSGAKYFQRKMTDKTWEHYKGPNMWFDAMRVVHQCEVIGQLSGAPWMVENPATRISTLWRQPDHKFQPYDYTGYAPEDNYKKRTWLWTGNGFIMPPPNRATGLGEPDDRIHKCPPGPERQNIRSVTPMGFARAVFEANHRVMVDMYP